MLALLFARARTPLIIAGAGFLLALALFTFHYRAVSIAFDEGRVEALQEVTHADQARAAEVVDRVATSRLRPRMRPETGDTRGYRD